MSEIVIREEIVKTLTTQKKSTLAFHTVTNQSNSDVVDTSNQYRLIDMKQITLLIGMTDKWIYSLIQKQQFPKPMKLGRSSCWRLRISKRGLIQSLRVNQKT